MPFTPEEIEAKRFLVALRGYDKEEVESFLASVAADYREVRAWNKPRIHWKRSGWRSPR